VGNSRFTSAFGHRREIRKVFEQFCIGVDWQNDARLEALIVGYVLRMANRGIRTVLLVGMNRILRQVPLGKVATCVRIARAIGQRSIARFRNGLLFQARIQLVPPEALIDLHDRAFEARVFSQSEEA
jgi:hypothetical protein